MAKVPADHGRAVDEPHAATDGNTVVYLNRYGGEVMAGSESSRQNHSTVLWMQGIADVDVPAWSRSDSDWNDLVDCVADRFAEYDVQITDERPTGNYVMAMVGGRPSMLGLGRSVGGIAPYNGRVMRDAIVYVFERSLGSRRSRCEATAHEIGHALGLDHSYLCSDIMSYGQCGEKEFRDESASCGEGRERSCSNGRATQNSHTVLARAVGLRPERPTPTPTPEPPRVASRPDHGDRDANGRRRADSDTHFARRLPPHRVNSAAPTVQIQSAAKRQPGNSRYVVSLRARDPDGIASVELFWTDGRSAYRLECGQSHGALPVACARRGDTYTFALGVGQGDRAFVVRVIDGEGNAALTKPRGVSFY